MNQILVPPSVINHAKFVNNPALKAQISMAKIYSDIFEPHRKAVGMITNLNNTTSLTANIGFKENYLESTLRAIGRSANMTRVLADTWKPLIPPDTWMIKTFSLVNETQSIINGLGTYQNQMKSFKNQWLFDISRINKSVDFTGLFRTINSVKSPPITANSSNPKTAFTGIAFTELSPKEPQKVYETLASNEFVEKLDEYTQADNSIVIKEYREKVAETIYQGYITSLPRFDSLRNLALTGRISLTNINTELALLPIEYTNFSLLTYQSKMAVTNPDYSLIDPHVYWYLTGIYTVLQALFALYKYSEQKDGK